MFGDEECDCDECPDDGLDAAVEEQLVHGTGRAELSHQQSHRRDEQQGKGVVAAHEELGEDLQRDDDQHQRDWVESEEQEWRAGGQPEDGAGDAVRGTEAWWSRPRTVSGAAAATMAQ
jgi:hypothetical protein